MLTLKAQTGRSELKPEVTGDSEGKTTEPGTRLPILSWQAVHPQPPEQREWKDPDSQGKLRRSNVQNFLVSDMSGEWRSERQRE